MPSSRGFFQSRDWIWLSWITGSFFTTEPLGKNLRAGRWAQSKDHHTDEGASDKRFQRFSYCEGPRERGDSVSSAETWGRIERSVFKFSSSPCKEIFTTVSKQVLCGRPQIKRPSNKDTGLEIQICRSTRPAKEACHSLQSLQYTGSAGSLVGGGHLSSVRPVRKSSATAYVQAWKVTQLFRPGVGFLVSWL